MSIQLILHLLQVCFHFSFFHCIQSLPISYPPSKNSLTHHPLNEIPYLYSKRRGDEKRTQENHVLYILDNYLHNWNAFFSLFFSKEIPKKKKLITLKIFQIPKRFWLQDICLMDQTNVTTAVFSSKQVLKSILEF